MANNKELPKKLRISAMKSEVLGVEVIRGFAKLSDLSRISRADIYDSKSNPTGTQRDLSPKHARDAYLYVRNNDKIYWPEIFLCARNPKVWEFDEGQGGSGNVGELVIDTELACSYSDIAISRVDGNHRLQYAGGDHDGFPAVEKLVSFSIAVDLSLEEEMKIFRDINNNQRKMNTSHLANINVKLTGERSLISRDPQLYLANKLSKEKSSPFFEIVYDGGKKDVSKFVPLNTLRTGLEYMLSQPTRLTAIDDINVQYKVIENYFSSLKKWEQECWEFPKKYIMLRGAGLWAVCFLGAEVIDRGLRKGNYKTEDFLRILKSGRDWDWASKGSFSGMSGRGGAVKIRDIIVAEFEDEEGVSLRNLMKEIAEEI